MSAKYDEIGEYYYEFVRQGLERPSHLTVSVAHLLEWLGDVSHQTVCDLACGEGHLSRILAKAGAAVTGIDLSQKLLEYAEIQAAAEELQITYIHDDAQTLSTVADESFDVVICHMALMDIPDLKATFQTINRILNANGCFVFIVLHPCFETPFTVPEEIPEVDAAGNFTAVRVRRYTEEGYWNSGCTGIRGRVGAHHRMLSTYLNTLLTTGFQITQLAEPTLKADEQNQSLYAQWGRAIPRTLLVKSQKTG